MRMSEPGWAFDGWRGVRRWLERLSGTSWVGVFVLAFSFLIALIEFLMHLKDARELMTNVILLGLRIEPKPDRVEIQGWLFFTASLAIFLWGAFFLLWTRAELRGRNDHTVRTLRGVMRATGSICKRLFPSSHLPDLVFEKTHSVFQIERDFTTQVRRTYQI